MCGEILLKENKSLLKEGMRYRIGNGDIIFFWFNKRILNEIFYI